MAILDGWQNIENANVFWAICEGLGLFCFIVSFCIFTSDKGVGKCVYLRSFVCLSVCVCLPVSKITQNVCMDLLDKMLRVDRCQDMDELINF